MGDLNAEQLISRIDALDADQRAIEIMRNKFIRDIGLSTQEVERLSNSLQTAAEAVTLLKDLSDESVMESYKFIADSVNEALDRAFVNVRRKIHLREYMLRKKHPQLEIELYSGTGKKRKFKATGHGLAQIVSLLVILCLIVINKSRRVLLLDEVLGGVSASARKVICEILWAFSDIGFQYVLIERGLEPKGAKIYNIINGEDEISRVDNEYICAVGKYIGVKDE